MRYRLLLYWGAAVSDIKAVFTLLLLYNFHGMSFLVSDSLYQFLMDGLLGRLDVRDAEYMLHMYESQVIGQGCNFLLYTLSFVSMTWQDAIFLSALNVVGSMLAWMIMDISMVQIDKEIFFLFAQRKEMVWKISVIAALLSAGEISAVCIFQKYKELQGERERHFAEEQQMKAMKRRLEEAENFYGGIRKVRHEMKGHMANIKGLAAGEKYEEAERYIDRLDETVQELDYKFSTGNAVTVALSDITVENGRINELDAPLDRLLNEPGQNQTYLDYRADILAIKNYEKMHGNSLPGRFSTGYAVDGETIRTIGI